MVPNTCRPGAPPPNSQLADCSLIADALPWPPVPAAGERAIRISAAEAVWNLAAQQLDREALQIAWTISDGWLWYLAQPAMEARPMLVSGSSAAAPVSSAVSPPPPVPFGGLLGALPRACRRAMSSLLPAPDGGGHAEVRSLLAACLPGNELFRGYGLYLLAEDHLSCLLVIRRPGPESRSGTESRFRPLMLYVSDTARIAAKAARIQSEQDMQLHRIENGSSLSGARMSPFRLDRRMRLARQGDRLIALASLASLCGLAAWSAGLALGALNPAPSEYHPPLSMQLQQLAASRPLEAGLEIAAIYAVMDRIVQAQGSVSRMARAASGEVEIDGELPAYTQPATLKAIHQNVRVREGSDNRLLIQLKFTPAHQGIPGSAGTQPVQAAKGRVP